MKIAYCAECKPPVVLSVGPGVAISHRVDVGTHKDKIKTIPMDPKDAQKPGETPVTFLDRIATTYKAQLV